MMPGVDPELRRLVALRTARSGLLRLKWHAAATRFQLALRRHDRVLKYGYNPNEPRVPRGNPGGGQWTTGGGSSHRVRLAGDFPTSDPPKIPKERPSKSRDRTAALKIVARHMLQTGEVFANIARLHAWLLTYSPIVESYNDPPKTLGELQRAASTPARGYDIHHIVEQSAARADGFTREDIDSPDNLVRVPTMKHWEINAWYQKPNPDYGWQTPREYLSGRNWEVRRAVGLKALVEKGVLKP